MFPSSLNYFIALYALALSLGIAQPGGAQSGPTPPPTSAALQPGDFVRLRIWREPDLSGEFQVDPTGIVTFPKIGPIRVTTETAESLRLRLVAAYQEVLRNASIEVVLLRRINVLGAVKMPGLYPIDPTMTIADAIALAGGATIEGDRRQIELLRGGERIAVKLDDAVRISDLPLRSGDQLFVPERSWISRNPGVLVSALSATASLILTILLRR